MATTRTDRKPAAKKGAAQAAELKDPTETLASEILNTLLHRALVRLGEPARPAEIARETDDEAITPALARRQMETQPRRFVAVDRRWDITSRYLDKTRPTERILEELVAVYGGPIPTDDVAGEMGQITGRESVAFAEAAPRLLRGGAFFPVAGGLAYGLRSWLLDLTSEKEADLLFYNYLTPDLLAPYRASAEGLDWDNAVEAAQAVVAAGGGQPVDNRIVQYFAWTAQGEDFDGAALYAAMATEREVFLALPEHRWLLRQALAPVQAVWRTLAELAATMVPEEPVAVEAASPVAEAPAKPLEVSAEDAEELDSYFDGHEDIIRVPDLLTQVFEVRPGGPTFAADTETLTTWLRSRPDQYVWVGNDRFRAPGTLPPYLGQLPESLTFPALPRFETADGEILDQMLSDEAFDGALKAELLDPIAQDVNDQEPAEVTAWPEGVSGETSRLRLVLKSHHKEIGTFPLAQVPPGFFPTAPAIVELTLRDSHDGTYPIYVDDSVQLVYGLFEAYENIAAESGAVFTLAKTDDPAVYTFATEGETDSGVFVSPARMTELQAMRTELEEGTALSTYDIVRRILAHYPKGCPFLTLLTEVNLVRRTPRRLLASVLSGYTAFYSRAKGWSFDPKKEPEGFNDDKAEFILSS